MTWSLQISDGDLNPFGPGGYAQVTGSQKLVQDLRNWLLEPRGTDPLHQDYGSTLDGGLDETGTYVQSNIGTVIDKQRLLSIESEVRRVLGAYQDQQMNRLYADQVALDGKNTFAPGEILYAVNDVIANQIEDVVVVSVQITTADGQSLSVTAPVSVF